MKRKIRLENWELLPCSGQDRPGRVCAKTLEAAGKEEQSCRIKYPMEAQEAYIETGLIAPTLTEDGDSAYCSWMQEKDWLYRCSFTAEAAGKRAYLVFRGIDTVADIFLNGQYLGLCESAYLEYRFDISGRLTEQNLLEVYVHSPEKMLRLYEEEMPESWRGEVNPLMLLRKGRDYGTPTGYMPVGIFGDVLLEEPDGVFFENVDYRVLWNTELTEAKIRFRTKLSDGAGENLKVCAEVTEEATGRAWKSRLTVSEDGSCAGGLLITDPLLWHPKNYGEQPMYRIRVFLWKNERIRDEYGHSTGLRHVRMTDSMRFSVNGREIRLWGAGIVPVFGLSHRYYEAYAKDMLDKLEKCNMNAVRVWGPGKAYPDAFYEELDRRGILVWQDFPTGTWQMPDDDKYRRLYRREAEYMVNRLKHHPSILLWCGGNEHIYMCELDEKKGRRGFEMLHEGYREVCARLDPDRYYHVSCPYEGKFANDPSYGDSHGSRAYCAWTPGEDYGVFFSEDIRVFPPQYKSAVRFMKEDIWEDGYVDTKPFGTEYAMPKGWEKHFSNNGHWKLGPVRNYYDAKTPQELIYKYAQAAAADLFQIGANARCGNPEYAQLEKRKRTGHLFWKFNDAWPRLYCAFYDYYQECTLPYYAVKRVFSPLFLHIAVKDHLYLWGVNDTAEDTCGKVTVKVFHLLKNEVIRELTFPAAYPAGRSSALCLDELGPLNWNCVLYARFEGTHGEKAYAESFLTQENMLAFPDARLEVSICGDSLTLRADRFARCVELSGISEEGNENGWYFDDNYFDLFPFETKTVKVETGHRKGRIEAKAHYSTQRAQVFSIRQEGDLPVV